VQGADLGQITPVGAVSGHSVKLPCLTGRPVGIFPSAIKVYGKWASGSVGRRA
jgi:hypothetical protein